jgi:protein SCO1/2
VPAFNPGFIGLTGTPQELEKVTRDFHVYANARKEGGTWLVDHSAQIFALDPAGRMRLVFAPDTPPQVLASDLRLLLNG